MRGSPATPLPDWLPLALALAIVVVWGATPVLTKLAAEEIEPLTVAVLRTLLGGVAAAPLALALRLPLPPRSLVLPFAISSFCAFVGFPLLFTAGQRMTSAMHGGLILAALPILTGLYAAVVERRRPKARWWAGCAIALTGEVVLIAGRAPAGQAAGSLGGDLLVVLSTLLAAMGYVAGARMSQAGYASIATTLWGVAAGSVLIAPIFPLRRAAGPFRRQARSLGALLRPWPGRLRLSAISGGTGRWPVAALLVSARSNSCNRYRGWSWPISSWLSGRASR